MRDPSSRPEVFVPCEHFCFVVFQFAYRTASTKFPGKLAELFLVLSDDHPVPSDPAVGVGASGPISQSRSRKHRLDDDQMSVESTGESKRPDVSTSAEKNKQKKQPSKSKPKGK